MNSENNVREVWKEKLIEEKDIRVNEETDYQWPFIRRTVEDYVNEKYLNKEDVCILDAGCGNGRYTDILIKNGWTSIYAMDLFEEKIFRQVGIECEYFQGSHTSIPKPDNSFDVIICCGSLFYLDKPEKGLKEFKRILKPGGVLLFSVVTKYSVFTLERCIRKFLKVISISYRILSL